MTTSEYVEKIRTARVYDIADETPLEVATGLSSRWSNAVLLKREDQQPTFSFKVRGAYNKMVGLNPSELARGVICASAGNHAQGVAMSALKLGCVATIVMPTTTPTVKIDAVAALGGRIVLHGDTYSDAAVRAAELEAEHGSTLVHPFDDPAAIAGQGTIAVEILRQHDGPIDAMFVPMGGGGLISGMAVYLKSVRPEITVIGVQAADSDAMARSLAAGTRVELDDVGLFSDGTAVKRVGEETCRLVHEFVDEFVVVDTDENCAAIKDVYEETHGTLEPAGALALAGMKQFVHQRNIRGKTLVVVASGANINFDRLRFVAERAEEHEALFAVTIPEVRGSFLRFSELVGARSVTEFNYRISDADHAHVFVGVTTGDCAESPAITRQFTDAGFDTIDLSHDELAKEHVRHMVGGRSQLAHDERLVSLSVPGAARRADAVPLEHARRLEHQPLPLPKSGCRLRAGPRRSAGPSPRRRRVRELPGNPRVPLCRRVREPGVPALPPLITFLR